MWECDNFVALAAAFALGYVAMIFVPSIWEIGLLDKAPFLLAAESLFSDLKFAFFR